MTTAVSGQGMSMTVQTMGTAPSAQDHVTKIATLQLGLMQQQTRAETLTAQVAYLTDALHYQHYAAHTFVWPLQQHVGAQAARIVELEGRLNVLSQDKLIAQVAERLRLFQFLSPDIKPQYSARLAGVLGMIDTLKLDLSSQLLSVEKMLLDLTQIERSFLPREEALALSQAKLLLQDLHTLLLKTARE